MPLFPQFLYCLTERNYLMRGDRCALLSYLQTDSLIGSMYWTCDCVDAAKRQASHDGCTNSHDAIFKDASPGPSLNAEENLVQPTDNGHKLTFAAQSLAPHLTGLVGEELAIMFDIETRYSFVHRQKYTTSLLPNITNGLLRAGPIWISFTRFHVRFGS